MPGRMLGLVVLLACAPLGEARAQEQPRDLVLDDVLVDDTAWASLTADADVQASVGPGGATIYGEATLSASAEAASPMRGSLDVDLVTSIVASRAQRVTMRAVADAIGEVEGVAAGRRYVRDLVLAAGDVLLDRGGLSRANVEALVETVVRLVMAEIVVRMRFPNANMLDRASYWERRLCSQGAGFRRPSAEGLAHCHRLRMGWPHGDVDETQIRLYLVDLAYWRLGATGLFGEEPRSEPPPCPFHLGTRGGVLCQVITGGATDDERDRRVSWVLDMQRLESGFAVARALHDRWNADGSGLRGFLRAVAHAREIGAFGDTPGLRSLDWDAARRMLDASLGMRLAITELFASVALAEHESASLASLARYRDAVADVSRRCDAVLACREGGVESFLRTELDTEAREGKVPQLPPEARVRLETLRASLEQLAESFHEAWGLPADADGLAIAKSRVGEVTTRATLGVWQEGVGTRVSVGTLRIHRLPRLRSDLTELGVVLRTVRDAFGHVPPTHWVVTPGDFAQLELSIRAIAGTTRLLELFASLNREIAREMGITTVGGALRGLESLAVETVDGNVATPMLDLLGPVLMAVERGRALDTGELFQLAAGIDEADVLRALGEDVRAAASCEVDEGSLACWTVRIVLSLREAMQVSEGRIAIDGAMFRSTLATLGEDFRARTEWRPYFHLTVGLGELGTFTAAPGDDTTDRFRTHAIVAEQIGFGVASPSFAGDNLTFRSSVFLSGLLYRAVFDNEESDALMVGLVAALDVYELLELYVAPMLLLFPGSDESSAQVVPGVAVGAQVPLGDYLSSL